MVLGVEFVTLQLILIKAVNEKSMKYIWLITFLVLPLIGSSYTAWRIWHMLPFASGWRWAATALFVVLFCSMFMGFSGAIEKMPLDTLTTVRCGRHHG